MSHGCWFLDVLAVLIMLPVIFPIACLSFLCLSVYLPNHPCSSICCWFLAASNCSDYITSWLSILWPDFHSVSLSVYLVAHICSLVCQICLLSYQITRCFYMQGPCRDGVTCLVAFLMHRSVYCMFTVVGLSNHLPVILSACLHILWSSLFLNIVLKGLQLLSASSYIHI